MKSKETSADSDNGIVRIGIIGLGYWGPNLVRNFVAMDGVELSWVCDSSPAKLNMILMNYPGIQGTANADDLVRNEDLDALVVVSSASTHYELTKRAMLAGKDVFVEKPLSLTVPEGEELVKIGDEAGRVLMVGHLLIYHPAVEKIKEYVDAGEIGELMYVYSQRLNLGRVRHDENCLWSLGPHDISVMLHLIGEDPLEVAVHGMNYLQEGIEDVIFCNLRFPRDIIANLHISWLDPHKERKITLVGKKKMLVFDDMSGSEKLRIYDKGVDMGEEYLSFPEALSLRSGDVVIPAVPAEEPLRRECEHFVDCIQSGKQPQSGGREGLKVLKILDAGQRSLESGGKPVAIQEEK